MRLLILAAPLALAACAEGQLLARDVAPTVVPTAQAILAAYTGVPASEQCRLLNLMRTYYPERLDEIVDRAGTKRLICAIEADEVIITVDPAADAVTVEPAQDAPNAHLVVLAP